MKTTILTLAIALGFGAAAASAFSEGESPRIESLNSVPPSFYSANPTQQDAPARHQPVVAQQSQRATVGAPTGDATVVTWGIQEIV